VSIISLDPDKHPLITITGREYEWRSTLALMLVQQAYKENPALKFIYLTTDRVKGPEFFDVPSESILFMPYDGTLFSPRRLFEMLRSCGCSAYTHNTVIILDQPNVTPLFTSEKEFSDVFEGMVTFINVVTLRKRNNYFVALPEERHKGLWLMVHSKSTNHADGFVYYGVNTLDVPSRHILSPYHKGKSALSTSLADLQPHIGNQELNEKLRQAVKTGKPD
jgi:hypothetical protein